MLKQSWRISAENFRPCGKAWGTAHEGKQLQRGQLAPRASHLAQFSSWRRNVCVQRCLNSSEPWVQSAPCAGFGVQVFICRSQAETVPQQMNFLLPCRRGTEKSEREICDLCVLEGNISSPENLQLIHQQGLTWACSLSSEYLEAHQAELDFLSGRHKDTKRNSRLVRHFQCEINQ